MNNNDFVINLKIGKYGCIKITSLMLTLIIDVILLVLILIYKK